MAALFALLFGDRLRPRIPVTAAPALYLEIDGDMPSVSHDIPGRMIAQASGWIEPDPFPVRIAVKTDGFVESVLVLEGQAVAAGELLATLDATNHMLRVARLEAEYAEAEAALAARDHEIAAAAVEVASAEARLAEAADRATRLRTLDDADVAPVERIGAERAEAEANARADSARLDVLTRQARRDQQKDRIAAIDAQLTQARIDLERTRVFSPMDGIVLERHAAPGMKRMAAMDDPDSASIVTLYDPTRLQARVDVPLSDIGRIETGMTARIVTAAFANRAFTGTVTRITGEADLTRNTLQVKVAIRDPDPRLRPEMLCRAEFLGSPTRPASATGQRAIWIPAAALVAEEGESASAWVIDPVEETAEPRDLVIGGEERDGLRPVFDGLRAGERVVTDGADNLRPGALVTMKKGGQP